MRVFLTGAFGNIGISTLSLLLERDYEVTCFDLPTPKNRRAHRKMQVKGKYLVKWGDIRKFTDFINHLNGVDVIIHLAAIIPPLSEMNSDLAKEVNVKGTENLIIASQSLQKSPKIILASSIAVYGSCMNRVPPRLVNDPLVPTDTYSKTKILAERLLKESALNWTILRLAAVSPLELSFNINPILFEIPLDQRIEFVHTRDVGRAFVNAIPLDSTNGRILHIGGGKQCQMYQREFIKKQLAALGICMLPDDAFHVPKDDSDWFYTDWLDTEEAEKLLKYQQNTYDDFLQEFRKLLGMKYYLIKLFGFIIKRKLTKSSPYYRQRRRKT